MKQNLSNLLNALRLTLLGGAVAVALGTLGIRLAANPSGPKRDVPVNLDLQPINRTAPTFASFAPVVDRVTPSVVKVFTTTRRPRLSTAVPPAGRQPGRRPPLQDGLPFGLPGFPFQEPESRGLGSAVIVSPDGYLLTNSHVVEDADEIRVSLGDDKKEYAARVVGRDPQSDIAVLKIDAEKLPAITFGDSDGLKVGDMVLAVGNPFGIGQTVTMGMVSATGRGNMGLDYEDFIQTDAAINPGNSGGALVDLEGRLVGINTAILSRSGGNNGIGFAVPANLARLILNDLVTEGRVIRGFLGVAIQDVSPDLAEAFDRPEGGGALVAQVSPRSPAQKAGIEEGDIILAFDGHPVRDSRHLKLLVAQARPGRVVPVGLIRNGKERTLEVTVRDIPSEARWSQRSPNADPAHDPLAGVAVADLDDRTRRSLQVPRDVSGAVIADIDPGSPAYRAGLRQGDVVTELDRRAVKDASTVSEWAQDTAKDRVLLRIWSRAGSRYVVINPARQG